MMSVYALWCLEEGRRIRRISPAQAAIFALGSRVEYHYTRKSAAVAGLRSRGVRVEWRQIGSLFFVAYLFVYFLQFCFLVDRSI